MFGELCCAVRKRCPERGRILPKATQQVRGLRRNLHLALARPEGCPDRFPATGPWCPSSQVCPEQDRVTLVALRQCNNSDSSGNSNNTNSDSSALQLCRTGTGSACGQFPLAWRGLWCPGPRLAAPSPAPGGLGTASRVEATALSLPATSVALVWLQAGGCWSPLGAHLMAQARCSQLGPGRPSDRCNWRLLLGPCRGFCCE